MDNDGSMVEQHGRDTSWVFLERAFITSHEKIKEQTRIRLDTVETLLSLDRLGVGSTSSAQVWFKDVVEASIRHAVLMKTVRCLGDLFSEGNIGTGHLELNCVILFAVALVVFLRAGNFILDVATNVAQWGVLKVAPESVDELVCKSGASLGGTGQGSEDTDEELSCTGPVSNMVIGCN
jgi:hypothetical protein